MYQHHDASGRRTRWLYLILGLMLVIFGTGSTPFLDPGPTSTSGAPATNSSVARPSPEPLPTATAPAVSRQHPPAAAAPQPQNASAVTNASGGLILNLKARTYRVAPGDSLWTIAQRHSVDVVSIMLANGLADAHRIFVGQTLTIPPVSGRLHRVTAGETLSALASRYGVLSQDIIAVNGLINANHIYAGQELVIPMESGTIRTEPPPAVPPRPTAYRVTRGDSLSTIAARFGITVDTLRQANNISDVHTVFAGQELVIPPGDGVLHRVSAGESLSTIAARYGVAVAEIQRANELSNANFVQAGQTLLVPGLIHGPVAPVVESPRPAAPQPAGLHPFLPANGRARIVVLDPGHGGGEIGSANAGITEKDVNLTIALKLRHLLEQDGFVVILTRDSDRRAFGADVGQGLSVDAATRLDLQTRVDIANNAGADVFISIHNNGSPDPGQSGTEVWYDGKRPFAAYNRALADEMQRALLDAIRGVGHPVVNRGVKDGTHFQIHHGHAFPIFVLGPPRSGSDSSRATQMPGTLGETLFLTNAVEVELLKRDEVLTAIAQGYRHGIQRYFRLIDHGTLTLPSDGLPPEVPNHYYFQ